MEQVPTNILLVEDDLVDQMNFKRLVKRENLPYIYTIASSVLEARKILSRQQFNIVVSDYLLGDGTAFDIFDAVGDTPFVIITGSGNELVAVKAMKEGAYDYLIKDPNQNYLQILPLTIDKAIRHKNTEDTLRLIQFERSVAGVFRFNLADGRLLTCNDAFAQILGFAERAEALDKPDRYLHFNQQDWEKFTGQLRQEKFLANYELQLQRPDDQLACVLMNVGFLEDVESGLEIIEGTLIDITERKRAEDILRRSHTELERQVKARTARLSMINVELKKEIAKREQTEASLRESMAQFRLLFENAPIGMGILTLEAQILKVNQAFCDTVGYTSEELVGQSIMDITYLDDITSNISLAQQVSQREASQFHMEQRYLHKDGHIIYVILQVNLIQDSEGQPLHLIGQVVDITARKQAEEELQKAKGDLEQRVADRTAKLMVTNAMLRQEISERQRAEESLRESEERYRGIFDTVPTSIIMIDHEGQIVDVNPYHVTQIGKGQVTRNDFLGQDIITRPSIVNAGLSETYKKVLEGETINLNEVYFPITTGGTDNFFNIKGVPLVKDGQVTGAVIMHENITEHKKLEAQLIQSQKMEAVGRLAGGVAHDFNNLLTVISGYSEFLLMRYADDHDPQREDVKQIQIAAKRAATLTRQLLAFSRKQIFQSQILNLNTIVTETDKMLRRLIGEDIEMFIDLDPHLGLVSIDPGQIEQVIMNLAINARDAMLRGGKLSIKTTNIELDEAYARQNVTIQPGPYILLTMTDTGIGMDAETQARIFEPFFTTKEKSKGTGLGLSTVYGIIKQSEGHIQVLSELGQGTTFKIYLPKVEQAVKIAMPNAVPVEVLEGSETILLVEDEAMVRNIACRILQENGYNVLEAQDGSDALRQSMEYKDPIHLLLTDVIMPGDLSGPHLAKQMISLHPTLKVIYMSGYTDDAMTHHGVLESGIALLEKPFTSTALVNRVRQILDSPRLTKDYLRDGS